MRITPDTGILVRMNVKAAGPARHLLEVILAGPHDLAPSEFLLSETARALRYPRLQKLYNLSDEDIGTFSGCETVRTSSPQSCTNP
jgi:hypothetical protein